LLTKLPPAPPSSVTCASRMPATSTAS
jgi:hypothetical protein